MSRGKGFAQADQYLWAKIAVAGLLFFATLGLCTALAQTPTSTPTTTVTVTGTLTPSGTPTGTPTLAPSGTPTLAATQTATSTPPAGPTFTATPLITLTPNASASPTVTRTRTPTRTKTPTHPVTGTATVTPAASAGLQGFLPVAGSLPGNFGSFFRTSVQLLNPGDTPITGRLVIHPAGTPGQPTDPAMTFTLAPGQVFSTQDLLSGLGLSGLASVDVFLDQGQTIPVAIARVFDDAGTNGTTGFTEPFVKASDVPDQGKGFLLGPSDVSHFRYNIGIRTLANPVTVIATVRDSGGNVLHSVTRNYDAEIFVQTSAQDFLGFSLGPDQSIEIDWSGGGLIAYGATIDNVTNDPSAQFLQDVTPNQTAQAGHRRGGPSAPIQLALVLAALGVGAGIVIAKR